MNKKLIFAIFQKYKKTAALILLILCSAGFSYHVITTFTTRHIESGTTNSHPKKPHTDLENIGGDWWEAKRFIYHGIPARIVFLLPPATEYNPDAINETAWLEFDRIGLIFNPFNPNSEIFRINAVPQAETLSVSDDIMSVMRISQILWIDSNGQFDPTMWQIKRLWQNAEKIQQIPSEKEITDALQWTGFDKVRIDAKSKNSVDFTNHPVKFDFGGIVKGYAVDQVRQLLIDSGVTAGLVQLGGEISTFGNNNKKPWRIGIQHPKQMDKLWGIISSKNSLRVSTSGNYRQPIQINEKSFYHIFSPQTGKPVSEKLLGVSTASFDGKIGNARLDGIATAITVMGATEGLALAEKLNIDVLILYEKKDGSIRELMTPGFSQNYSPYDR